MNIFPIFAWSTQPTNNNQQAERVHKRNVLQQQHPHRTKCASYTMFDYNL